MAVLGIQAVGLKMLVALFSDEGKFLHKDAITLKMRDGYDFRDEIKNRIAGIMATYSPDDHLNAIGIAVPGNSQLKNASIFNQQFTGADIFWKDVQDAFAEIPVAVEDERVCSIKGESWQGNLQMCRHAIYLHVGDGIDAVLQVNGKILDGARNLAGAVSWMAMERPFDDKYLLNGCLGYHVSRKGICTMAIDLLKFIDYPGSLGHEPVEDITVDKVFKAYEEGDLVGDTVIRQFIEYMGMAIANLVSMLNPEKIIVSGPLFGPAISCLPEIFNEAEKWGHPLSMSKVKVELAKLGEDSALYGAAFLAINKVTEEKE